MINNKPYWVKKEEKARQAKAHTKDMEKYATGHNTCYGTGPGTEGIKEKPKERQLSDLSPVLLETDTVSGLFAAKKMNKEARICVLNFASYKNPGGGFLNGSSAQEEAICHESNLYNTICTEDDFYGWNRKNLNRGLYLNRAIYSEGVTFIHGGKEVTADVLTCAAPNFRAASEYGKVSREENNKVLQSRIRFILDVMQHRGVHIAVLGAFGCGVFRQDAETVAKMFKETFTEQSGIKPVYAVIKGLHDENLVAFKKLFS